LDRVLPAVSAAASAVVLAALLLPLVLTRQYRLRGSPDAGRLAHRFLALLYACALANYAFGPLPDRSSEIVCRDQPQLVPLGGLAGLDLPVSGRQLLAGLAREPNQQFALNVLLFLPLGMLLRSAFRLRPPVLAAAGFAVSALVELTQLTGLWFAYPCPYRLFDVDDLVANTTGALIGGVLGPLLPRPAPVDRPPQLPRPVTRLRPAAPLLARRLPGHGCAPGVRTAPGRGALRRQMAAPRAPAAGRCAAHRGHARAAGGPAAPRARRRDRAAPGPDHRALAGRARRPRSGAIPGQLGRGALVAAADRPAVVRRPRVGCEEHP
jgi:hypothetical protein